MDLRIRQTGEILNWVFGMSVMIISFMMLEEAEFHKLGFFSDWFLGGG